MDTGPSCGRKSGMAGIFVVNVKLSINSGGSLKTVYKRKFITIKKANKQSIYYIYFYTHHGTRVAKLVSLSLILATF